MVDTDYSTRTAFFRGEENSIEDGINHKARKRMKISRGDSLFVQVIIAAE
jgi:hypothetical protein